MGELILELYSEEIPPQLQIEARKQLQELIEKAFLEENINYKKIFSYSSPTRLSLIVIGLPDELKIKSKEIRGPKVNSPDLVLQNFTKAKRFFKKPL